MGTELKIVWGEINECCRYQAKLQQNLMYLAAIADAQQPQAGTTAAHNPPPQVLKWFSSSRAEFIVHSMLLGSLCYTSFRCHEDLLRILGL
jgi:hypothetical protein